MSTVRLRRLGADYAKVKDYVRRHPRVRLIQAQGDPPERYQFEYRIHSLRMVHNELQPIDTHLVEVTLPLNYPRTPPQCRMLSPVFHPNIAPHAICVGDHWSAGESLQSIITRIGEMLAYQSYNVKSPLNGEAARWVEENKHLVPLDPVSLLVEEERTAEPLAEPAAGPPRPPEFSAGAPPPPATAPLGAPPPLGTVPPPGSVPSPAARMPLPPPPPGSTNGMFPAIAARPVSAASPPPAATQADPHAERRIVCPTCGSSYRFQPELAGRTVRCKKCDTTFEVTAPP